MRENEVLFHSLVSPSTGFYSGVLGIVSCFLILFLTIAAIDLPNSQSLLVAFPDSSVVPIALQRNNKETLQECRILGAELNAGIAPRRKNLIGGCFSKGLGPKSHLFISALGYSEAIRMRSLANPDRRPNFS